MELRYTRLSDTVAEILDARSEDENSHDRHAVAVVIDSCVVGNLPHEYSRIVWHFLQHRGKILCEITGKRRRGLGLVVPCVYILRKRVACMTGRSDQQT